MFTNLAPNIYRKRIVIEGIYKIEIKNKEVVKNFLLNFANEVKDGPEIMKGMRECIVNNYEFIDEEIEYGSYEGSLIWNEHEVRFYNWHKEKFFTLDIYTCSPFDTDSVINFVANYFSCSDFSWHESPQPEPFNQNINIELRTGKMGVGVYAKSLIPKNTFLTYIDGEIVYAKNESELEKVRKSTKDHAVALSKYFYRNAFSSMAVKINHSCEPNAYLKDLFCVYSMRDIQEGEEIFMSYSLFTNSDWKVPGGKCLCGTLNCYGTIVPWRDLKKSDKIKYLEYTTDWILFEEMKKNGYLEKLKLSI